MSIEKVPVQSARPALAEALLQIGTENERVVIVDSETAPATNVLPFKKKFPDRFIQTGIAEQCAVSVAYGLQTQGYIPIVPLFAVFLARRAFDQVYIHVGYPNANVKLIGCYAGLTAASVGATHQAFNDIALMRTIPNMTVIEAADAVELQQAVRKAVEIEGPVYIRVVRSDLAKYEYRQVPEDYEFQLGKATVLQEGKDITLVGSGIMLSRCREAAEKLAAEGISAEIINVSTIKPLDDETIVRSAEKTRHVVVAENSSVIGGLGSAVAEVLSKKCPTPMEFVGIQDRFGHSGTFEELTVMYNLTADDVLEKAHAVLKK